MSVEVIETTDGMTSWAMSAKDGSSTPPPWGRAAGTVSRWASDLGVTWTEPATTIPKTTAAAIKAEKERARLMLLSMAEFFLLMLSRCGTLRERGFSNRHSGIWISARCRAGGAR